jgi:hypothetical protein
LSRLEAVTRRALTGAILTNLSPTKRNPLVSDSAADHHRDLTVLTTAVGGELDRAIRAVNTTLGMTGKQPCSPDPPPRVAAGNAGFPAATSPGQAPGRGACDLDR